MYTKNLTPPERVRPLLYMIFCGLALLTAGCAEDDPSILDRTRQADVACVGVDAALAGLPGVPMQVHYGFFTDFEPLSYAATQNPDAPLFNVPLGYEPALVAALGRLGDDRLQFHSIGIGNPFDGIWLLSALDSRFDMVGGGITALEERRFAPGDPDTPLINFGTGHVQFRQSLLVRNESPIMSHDDLDSATTVGVLKGTTGESRLLQLTGIADREGYLRARTTITLGENATLVTGERTHRITGSSATPGLAARTRLVAPGNDVPLVVYLSSEVAQVQAVLNGAVDAIARGEIGNLSAAGNSAGKLRVTAIDTESTEMGAFSYPDTEAGDILRTTLDVMLNCLTDNGEIGFAQWHEDALVFDARAQGG